MATLSRRTSLIVLVAMLCAGLVAALVVRTRVADAPEPPQAQLFKKTEGTAGERTPAPAGTATPQTMNEFEDPLNPAVSGIHELLEPVEPVERVEQADAPEREAPKEVPQAPVSETAVLRTPSVFSPYPWKEAIATVFWVGEDAATDNGFIHNRASAWDGNWERSFGGVDDPEDRCGYLPCAFTPRENPFYVALPYNDFTDEGVRKENVRSVPWYVEPLPEGSLLKNRWVEVRNGAVSCFGQWQDVGPFEQDDVAYVFGEAAAPKNKQGVAAGIDLSPALAMCAEVPGQAAVSWRFVDDAQVPQGPWKDIVTVR